MKNQNNNSNLVLQKHDVVFGEEIQALNFNICNINEVITQTHMYSFSLLLNK